MKYLIIEDDGCWQADRLTPNTFRACIAGLCQIFSVRHGEQLGCDGQWHSIPTFEEVTGEEE